MHIKTFLKKITDRPLQESYQPINFERLRRQNKKLQQKYRIDGKYLNENSYISNRNENAMKYLEHRNPSIKNRLINSRQSSISPDVKIRTTFFRQKIQKKLSQLMNQKKELVITKSRISHSSLGYKSQKEKKQQISNRQMPQFVQNIMKPCKIKSMSILKRCQTDSKLHHMKSQPKIYCKKPIDNKNDYSKRVPMTAAIYSRNHQAKGQKQIQLVGWIDSKTYQQSAELWPA